MGGVDFFVASKVSQVSRGPLHPSAAPPRCDHDLSPEVMVMIVIERARLLPSPFYASPWTQSAAPVAQAVPVRGGGGGPPPHKPPLGPLWQLADVPLTVCEGILARQRPLRRRWACRRRRLRAGARPPGGAGVDGCVMKEQAGVRFRVRVSVAD